MVPLAIDVFGDFFEMPMVELAGKRLNQNGISAPFANAHAQRNPLSFRF